MARRRKHPFSGTQVDAALTLSVSLFLILLTFFILLNSIAVFDERRKLSAIGSLVGAFGAFPGGSSPSKTGESYVTPFAPLEKDKITLFDSWPYVAKYLMGEIKIKSSENREIITISEKVLFKENRSSLRPSSYPFLDKLCDLISKGDYPVEIIGHTDNTPAEEKGYSSNWELSMLMGIKVLRYFEEKGKLASERLSAYGYGSQRPIASNDTRQTRAENRRVDIVLQLQTPTYIGRIYPEKPPGIFTYRKFDFRVF
jgi:chemotaxis protein MotB